MEELKLKGLNETIYVYETKAGLKIYIYVDLGLLYPIPTFWGDSRGGR